MRTLAAIILGAQGHDGTPDCHDGLCQTDQVERAERAALLRFGTFLLKGASRDAEVNDGDEQTHKAHDHRPIHDLENLVASMVVPWVHLKSPHGEGEIFSDMFECQDLHRHDHYRGHHCAREHASSCPTHAKHGKNGLGIHAPSLLGVAAVR